MNDLILKILSKRWLLHGVFWLLIFVDGYLGSVQYLSTSKLIEHLLTSRSIYMVEIYLNIWVLYPRFFQRGKIWQYLLSLVVLVLLFSTLSYQIYVYNQIFKAPRYITYLFSHIYLMGFATGAKFLRSGVFNFFLLQKIQEEQKTAELNLLRAQVNPHFLFNTLNNLYALVLEKSAKAPETVLILSELMRYMNSTAGLQRVPLQQEIDYLRNYVQLEKLRLNEGASMVTNFQGDFSKHQIAPLILLPFVENAFKHGVETQTANIEVELTISLQRDELYFHLQNAVPLQAAQTADGTGLMNVRKRLELIYPQKHQLDINAGSQKFEVYLIIDLEE